MDGASLADYPGYSEALDQWREIMVNYQNSDCKTIDTARAEQMFANGETGMIIIGTWGLGAIMIIILMEITADLLILPRKMQMSATFLSASMIPG